MSPNAHLRLFTRRLSRREKGYPFAPLGIRDTATETPLFSGIHCTHGEVCSARRDRACCGYLFLTNAVWHGGQIFSSSRAQQCTPKHLSPGVSWLAGYGEYRGSNPLGVVELRTMRFVLLRQ